MITKTLQLVRRNFSFLLAAEVLIRIMMLVLTIFLARFYGTEKFGIYALALSVGNLFEIIFNLGLGTVFMQRVSGAAGQMRDQLKLFLPLRLLLSLASFALFVIFAVTLQKNTETFVTLILAGFYFSLFSIESFLWTCFDAKQKMHFTAGTKLLKFTVIFSLGLIFTFQQSPVYFLMLAYIAGVTVAIVTTIIFIVKYFTQIGWRADFLEWKKIISEGWPITLSGAFIFIYNSLDTIIISIMKGEQSVGLYQVSYKIIGTIFILATLINQAYLPTLMDAVAKNKPDLHVIFNKAVKSVLFWSIPITMGGMMLGERIITFIFGNEYLAGVAAFKILIWNCVIFFLSSAMTSLLYAAKKQKSAMKIFFFGAAANIIFNVFMIPIFGIVGAALTTVLAEIVVLAGIYLLARKITPVKLAANAWQPLVAALIMVGALSLVTFNSLILTIAIGGLIYFGAYFLLSRLTAPAYARVKTDIRNVRHESFPHD